MQLEVILAENNSQPRVVKQRQLKSHVHKFETRARERPRKRATRRQAEEAQREKGRQRSRVRDKKQRRNFLLEEQLENFVAALTK